MPVICYASRYIVTSNICDMRILTRSSFGLRRIPPSSPITPQNTQWPQCQSPRSHRHLLPNGSSYRVRTFSARMKLHAKFKPGVDSEQLRWSKDEEFISNIPQAPVEPTIEEDNAETDDASNFISSTPRNKKRNSYQRLSRLSDEARLSISSFSPAVEMKGTDSNRSSTTIKAIQINGTNTNNNGGLNDYDFDKALRKFASERDSFLSDLSLSAGAIMPNRPKPRPKTQRIVSEDSSTIKSGVGSIRRRISFRDMGSMKRQSSVARQGKFRGHHFHPCILGARGVILLNRLDESNKHTLTVFNL